MGGWTGGRQAVGGWWIAKPQWSHTACLHHFPSSILQFSRTGLLSTHKQKLWAFQKSEHDSRTCWPVQQKDRDPKKSLGQPLELKVFGYPQDLEVKGPPLEFVLFFSLQMTETQSASTRKTKLLGLVDRKIQQCVISDPQPHPKYRIQDMPLNF